MLSPRLANTNDTMDVLNFWTKFSLTAYWKELVKEAQEANFTGSTHDYISDFEDTPFTG